MTCYLYDEQRRRHILTDASNPRGSLVYLAGYGPSFEVACLMLKEGLLTYSGEGYGLRLVATDAGLRELARLGGPS